MSQNPDTKDYFMVLQEKYCESCGRRYIDLTYKWCKFCQTNNLKKHPIKWTSKNGKIDSFIQEIQSEFIGFLYNYNEYNYNGYNYNGYNYNWYGKTEHYYFEWIPYNQFNGIREINKDDS